jgi:hypothetical protein
MDLRGNLSNNVISMKSVRYNCVNMIKLRNGLIFFNSLACTDTEFLAACR